MKCTCKNYNECIGCHYYYECDDKPYNPKTKWILLGWIAFISVVTTLIII